MNRAVAVSWEEELDVALESVNQTSYDETMVEIGAVGSVGSVGSGDLGEVVVELVVVAVGSLEVQKQVDEDCFLQRQQEADLIEVDLQQNGVVVAVEGEERAFHFEWFDNLTRKIFDCSSLAAVVVEEDHEEGSVPSNLLEPGYSDAKRFEGRDYIPHSIEDWEGPRV